jgi:hypothetical protein
MDYYKKYLKYKSKYTLAKKNMRGGAIDILDYYKQTVGLVTYRQHEERHGTGIVEAMKQSYCDRVIADHNELIQLFDLSFKHLGSVGYGLGKFISIVKEWTHHMELIFALALDSSNAFKQVKPYLLANGITIYPMCLCFVCRLVLNELCKEKEDLYCLLKEVNDKAIIYWGKEKALSILSDGNPSFIPTCLLVGHMRFPDTTSRFGKETKDTLYAWFGIMNPNELTGLANTKSIIMNFINKKISEKYKQEILLQIQGLSDVSETGIIRENYNSPGNTLHVNDIAKFLLLLSS